MMRQIMSGSRIKTIAATVVLTAALSVSLTGGAVETITPPKSVPQYPLTELLARLPTGERWLAHLRDDLLPFWLMDSAIGNPRGNFPTYRCNDGSPINPARLCPEQRYATAGIVFIYPEYRQYLRVLSRQIYAYAVAFHLTGDESLLKLAYDGINFERTNFFDHKNGGAYSYRTFRDGQWIPGPASLQRTSQDLAYAATGIGMVYYLTRDPQLLEDLLALKNHIFRTYFDQEQQFVTWVRELSPDGDTTDQRELVAQLDQVYAFMLAATPALPEPHRTEWKNDLTKLARTLIEQFYSPRQNLFWGAATATETRRLETPHTDFGHSVKTLWMIHLIGRMTNNLDLVTFGWRNATALLEQAYLPETGSWGRRPLLDGTIDPDKEWWGLAELDQVSATFSLIDPNYAGYLIHTYDYWFKYMVDHENHEIWHMVDGRTNRPYPCGPGAANCFPKQHSWKDALHSFEHCLVGYITAQQFHTLPVTLYYAFAQPPEPGTVQPYFYTGHLANLDPATVAAPGNRKIYRATFTHVR